MSKFVMQRYEITHPKIRHTIRLVQVSDLHCCLFGTAQATLVQAIIEARPDFVVMTGDIADDKRPLDNAMMFVRELATKLPCYYVTGNHEIRRPDLEEVKARFRSCGIRIISGDGVRLSVRGQVINLIGTEDPTAVTDFASHLQDCFHGIDHTLYTILLSHKPEYVEEFLRMPCDLVLSGHAHGGQWRIPGLVNGLFAPGQGLFPKYAGGQYDHGSMTHIVSRGLDGARLLLPRLFNPREVVVIDLKKE